MSRFKKEMSATKDYRSVPVSHTNILFQRAERTRDVDVWSAEPFLQGEREGQSQRRRGPLPPETRGSHHTERRGWEGGVPSVRV